MNKDKKKKNFFDIIIGLILPGTNI